MAFGTSACGEMDIIAAFEAVVVGSNPTRRTKDTNTSPAGGFVLLCEAERCFALAKPRAGVASEFVDEQTRLVTTRV